MVEKEIQTNVAVYILYLIIFWTNRMNNSIGKSSTKVAEKTQNNQ